MTEVLRSRLLPRGSQQHRLAARGSGLTEVESLASHELRDTCRVGGLRRGSVSETMISKQHVFTPDFHAVYMLLSLQCMQM